MNCKICGSYAINHNHHGRDGTEPELCDVCFWREKAKRLRKMLKGECFTDADIDAALAHGKDATKE